MTLFIKLGSNVGKMPDVRPVIEFVSLHTPLIDTPGGGFRNKAGALSYKIAEDRTKCAKYGLTSVNISDIASFFGLYRLQQVFFAQQLG